MGGVPGLISPLFWGTGGERLQGCLELRVLRGARERDDVTDVLHAGDEEDQALEAQAEAGMRAGAVLPRVEVPLVVAHVHVASLDLLLQLVVALLTDGAADDLSDAGEEDIRALHRAAVSVLLHVERLDLRGIVRHDHRAAEVLLDEVTLVLRGKVHAPSGDGELKLMSVLHGLLEDADALGVGQTDEVLLDDGLQGLQERLVDHLVEELQVVTTVVQRPLNTVLDELLLEVHQLVLVHERNLRLDHPELREVARGVRVLSTERRTEGVDGTQRRGTEFSLELSADGEVRLLPEEVAVVLDLSRLRHAIEVEGRHLEHLACPLRVAGGDERGVEVVEPMVVEELMYGDGHVVTDAEDGAEGVRAEAHVRILPHVLKRLSLLLHGEVGRTESVDLDVRGLYLRGLSLALALDECACGTDAGAGGDALEHLRVEACGVHDDLDVLDR